VRSKVDPTNPLGLPPLKKKEDLLLMRKAPNESLSVPETAPLLVDDVLQTSGEPLEAGTRRFFEGRFGYDFGAVRIHRDTRAAESARAVHAQAYTVGRDIVFNSGGFAPDSEAGCRLLAHELTHVVQQRGDDRPLLQRFAPFEFIGDIFSVGPSQAFARLFGEGTFSTDELLAYLGKLTKEGQPEGRYDSDNKARAVVRLWKTGDRKIQLTPQLKKLLIVEMWKGTTTRGDAEGILDLLERSFLEDVTVIFGPGGVTPKDLFDSFSAADQGRLQQFFDQRVEGGLKTALTGTVKPTGGVTVAPFLNDETMRRRWLAGLDKGLNLLTRKI